MRAETGACCSRTADRRARRGKESDVSTDDKRRHRWSACWLRMLALFAVIAGAVMPASAGHAAFTTTITNFTADGDQVTRYDVTGDASTRTTARSAVRLARTTSTAPATTAATTGRAADRRSAASRSTARPTWCTGATAGTCSTRPQRLADPVQRQRRTAVSGRTWSTTRTPDSTCCGSTSMTTASATTSSPRAAPTGPFTEQAVPTLAVNNGAGGGCEQRRP